MNVLLVDREGYFLDFALRCREAGHVVRWYLGKNPDGSRNPLGDGFGLDKRSEWESSMRWADLIVLPDNATMMHQMNSWHDRGFPIWGPNKEVTAWEMDRALGLKVLENVGVDLIASHSFKRLDEGIAFVLANPKRYVFKLLDDNNAKAMSYVSKSAKDMMFMLQKWKKMGAVKHGFIFQEFVPGIEVAVGGWFGQSGFSQYFLENWEHKKLMNGEIGVNTGEMGTVMKYVKESKLADMLLRPLEGDLFRAGFTGYIDVAVIVAKDGTPYPLEFTTRPGWPLFQIQQCLHPDPCGWMKDSLDGRDTFRPLSDVATGVVVSMPDFPYKKLPQEALMGFPLYGWDVIQPRNLHLNEVMLGEAPNDELALEEIPVTVGCNVATISGQGKTVEQSIERAYKNVKKLELPNSPMYRTDIGCRLEEQLPLLQAKGFMKDWSFK